MAGELDKERKIMLFMIGLIALEFMIVLIIGHVSPLQRFEDAQRAMVTMEMGRSAENTIHAHTSATFNDWFIQTGLMHSSMPRNPSYAYRPNALPLTRMGLLFHQRILALWALLWLSMYRMFLWLAWMPALLPLIVAAVWDGWNRRRIGQWKFQFQSATRHYMGSKTAKGMMALAVMLFFVPIPIPPLLIPLWAVFFAVGLHTWTTWLPKRM